MKREEQPASVASKGPTPDEKRDEAKHWAERLTAETSIETVAAKLEEWVTIFATEAEFRYLCETELNKTATTCADRYCQKRDNMRRKFQLLAEGTASQDEPCAPVVVSGGLVIPDFLESGQGLLRKDSSYMECVQDDAATTGTTSRYTCRELAVVVDSVAGSGKTTTNLFIAKQCAEQNKQCLILTYNAKLKVETREKIEQLGLAKFAECHTYHSFCVKYWAPDCFVDTGIRKFLDRGSLGSRGSSGQSAEEQRKKLKSQESSSSNVGSFGSAEIGPRGFGFGAPPPSSSFGGNAFGSSSFASASAANSSSFGGGFVPFRTLPFGQQQNARVAASFGGGGAVSTTSQFGQQQSFAGSQFGQQKPSQFGQQPSSQFVQSQFGSSASNSFAAAIPATTTANIASKIPKYFLVICDEAQDLTPLYFETLCKIFKDHEDQHGGKPKLIVMGDRHQSIYGFNMADERFIVFAPQLFSQVLGIQLGANLLGEEIVFSGNENQNGKNAISDTRQKGLENQWARLKLSQTFRCTVELSKFVNEVMLWNHSSSSSEAVKLHSCKSHGVKPRYLICSVFSNYYPTHEKDPKFPTGKHSNSSWCYAELLRYLGSGYQPQDIFVLAPSIRSEKTPVRKLENMIKSLPQTKHVNVYVPGSDNEKLDAEIAKGLERKVVLVYGWDAKYFQFYCKNKNPELCPNALYVAATRSLEQVTFFHHFQNQFLPFLNLDKLEECCEVVSQHRAEEGFTDEWGVKIVEEGQSLSPGRGGPQGHCLEDEENGGKKFFVTPATVLCRHLPDIVLEKALTFFSTTTIRTQKEKIHISTKTAQAETHESVAEITGVAIMTGPDGKSLQILETLQECEMMKGAGTATDESLNAIVKEYNLDHILGKIENERAENAKNIIAGGFASAGSRLRGGGRAGKGTKKTVGKTNQDRLLEQAHVAPKKMTKAAARAVSAFNRSVEAAQSSKNDPQQDEDELQLSGNAGEAPNHNPQEQMRARDILQLATKYTAVTSGFVHKLSQITNFSWLSQRQLEQATERLFSLDYCDRPETARFERFLSLKGRRELRDRDLQGYLDLVCGGGGGNADRDAQPVVYEFKCVAELEAVHKIQVALYAYLHEIDLYEREQESAKVRIRELFAMPVLSDFRMMGGTTMETAVSDDSEEESDGAEGEEQEEDAGGSAKPYEPVREIDAYYELQERHKIRERGGTSIATTSNESRVFELCGIELKAAQSAKLFSERNFVYSANQRAGLALPNNPQDPPLTRFPRCRSLSSRRHPPNGVFSRRPGPRPPRGPESRVTIKDQPGAASSTSRPTRSSNQPSAVVKREPAEAAEGRMREENGGQDENQNLVDEEGEQDSRLSGSGAEREVDEEDAFGSRAERGSEDGDEGGDHERGSEVDGDEGVELAGEGGSGSQHELLFGGAGDDEVEDAAVGGGGEKHQREDNLLRDQEAEGAAVHHARVDAGSSSTSGRKKVQGQASSGNRSGLIFHAGEPLAAAICKCLAHLFPELRAVTCEEKLNSVLARDFEFQTTAKAFYDDFLGAASTAAYPPGEFYVPLEERSRLRSKYFLYNILTDELLEIVVETDSDADHAGQGIIPPVARLTNMVEFLITKKYGDASVKSDGEFIKDIRENIAQNDRGGGLVPPVIVVIIGSTGRETLDSSLFRAGCICDSQRAPNRRRSLQFSPTFIPKKMRKIKVIVVVDPYSAGKLLVRELHSQSAVLVAVRSSVHLPSFWLDQLGGVREFFCEVVDYEPQKTPHYLAEKYKVDGVVAGSEPGVFLAEELQAFFRLTARNDVATKHYRRHKFDMQNRLSVCGLRSIRQIFSRSVEEVLAWQKESLSSFNGGTIAWPIIVKPAASGGSDGVYWCHSGEDVKNAFDKELEKVNVNGVRNEKLLAQEFLRGTEYVVNSVSFAGKHVVTGIFRYKKHLDEHAKSITYESTEIVDCLADTLIAYTHECLDALGFRYGASHAEVMIEAGGPCLIEVGARLHGGLGCVIEKHATGLSSYELLADLLLNDGRVISEMHARGFKYVIRKRSLEYMLRNVQAEGVTLQQELDDGGRLSSLPGVVQVSPYVGVGEVVPVTRDVVTSPADIVVSHVNKAVVDETISKIQAMEASGELWYGTSGVKNKLSSGNHYEVDSFDLSSKGSSCVEEEGKGEERDKEGKEGEGKKAGVGGNTCKLFASPSSMATCASSRSGSLGSDLEFLEF
eukprot:g6016.t1